MNSAPAGKTEYYMGIHETYTSLAELINRGGIYHDVQGTTIREAINALIVSVPSLRTVQADKLLQAVLEREALMSTSIGHGIALPHPRNPLITNDSEQFTALAFLKNPMDWNSLDGEKADTVFLIVSSSAKQHLHTLSEINFFCRKEDFRRLLREHTRPGDILNYIKETEINWKQETNNQ